MTSSAEIVSRVVVTDDVTGTVVSRSSPESFAIADVVGSNGKRENHTVAAAFAALTPPTGATFVRIRWVSGVGTITLKGVTGDTGVACGVLTAASPPICLPISAPSIGITGSAAGVLEIEWL